MPGKQSNLKLLGSVPGGALTISAMLGIGVHWWVCVTLGALLVFSPFAPASIAQHGIELSPAFRALYWAAVASGPAGVALTIASAVLSGGGARVALWSGAALTSLAVDFAWWRFLFVLLSA